MLIIISVIFNIIREDTSLALDFYNLYKIIELFTLMIAVFIFFDNQENKLSLLEIVINFGAIISIWIVVYYSLYIILI